MENKTIKGYKGFDKDLKCRGFQYEVGKEYSTDKAVACETGFHYCENPMDVLNFYTPCDDTGNLNRFCEVEGSGDFDISKSDKICCTHLKVKAEIGLQGLIKAGFKVHGGINAPYIWLKTPNNISSWKFFDQLLYEVNIVSTPGVGFGPSGEGYLRLTAFGQREECIEAMQRIQNWI